MEDAATLKATLKGILPRLKQSPQKNCPALLSLQGGMPRFFFPRARWLGAWGGPGGPGVQQRRAHAQDGAAIHRRLHEILLGVRGVKLLRVEATDQTNNGNWWQGQSDPTLSPIGGKEGQNGLEYGGLQNGSRNVGRIGEHPSALTMREKGPCL